MNLDLTKIKILSIDIPRQKTHLMQCQIVQPILNQGHRLGCGKSHIKCTKRSLQIDGPVLILQNDAEKTQWYNDIIQDIPENTDILYLGYSTFHGLFQNKEIINDNFVKMTTGCGGTHAILLITQKGKQSWQKNCIQALNLGLHIDQHCKQLIKKCNVIMCGKPLFFQGGINNVNKKCTKQCLIKKNIQEWQWSQRHYGVLCQDGTFYQKQKYSKIAHVGSWHKTEYGFNLHLHGHWKKQIKLIDQNNGDVYLNGKYFCKIRKINNIINSSNKNINYQDFNEKAWVSFSSIKDEMLDLYLPVAKAWKKFGYKVYFSIIGQQQKIQKNQFGIIHYIKASHKYPLPWQSQISRMWTMRFIEGIGVTSDLDSMPLQALYFDNLINLVYNNSISISRKNPYQGSGWNGDYCMMWTAANSTTWKSVLDIQCSFQQFCQKVQKLSGGVNFHSDEIYLTKMINKNCHNKIFMDNIKINRIDRSKFNFNIQKLKNGEYTDSHLPKKYKDNKNKIDTLSQFSNYYLKETEQSFTEIYKNKKWGTDGDGSGSGSQPNFCKQYKLFLEDYFQKNNIKSIIDLGCGSWKWTKDLKLNNIKYTGIDIVKNVIDNNIDKFSTENIKFEHKNIIQYTPQISDIIHIKDVLQHLSLNSIYKIINNISKSGNKKIIVTQDSFLGKTQDCKNGGYRQINIYQIFNGYSIKQIFKFKNNIKVSYQINI